MFFQKQFGSIEGLAYILLIFSFTIFWFSGYKLINRSSNHFIVTSRFDLGIAMLVLTFIIAGSTDTFFPNASVLISYYFLFAILAIIISKHFKCSKTEHCNQQYKPNLIFTFIPIVLLFVSWALLFFLPQMTSAAQVGYYILKEISNPVGKLLLRILSLLFGHSIKAINADIHTVEHTIPIPEENELTWLSKILQWITIWGGIVLFGLLTIFTIGWLLYSFWKWLSLKTELDIEKKVF